MAPRTGSRSADGIASSTSPTSFQARSSGGKRKKPSRPEAILQASLIDFYVRCVDHQDSFLFAVPNGEKRDKVTAARLAGISRTRRKALDEEDRTLPFGQGVVPGAWDLVLLLSPRSAPLAVALIEVKIPELRDAVGRVVQAGGTLSKEQRDVHRKAERIGHTSFVVTSIETFEALLRALGLRVRTIQAPPRRLRTPAEAEIGAGWDMGAHS